MQIESLRLLITNHSIISFDIFDTLLVRPYAKPIDVFKHLEENFRQKGFASLRSKAEFKAMKALNKKQVNFDEIYSQMPSRFHFLKAKEKELESQTLYVNPFCKELFDYAKNLNKTIILTSDMYHSSEFLKEVLEKNDIRDYHKIYVSSEIGKTKHHKDLYEHIIKDLQVEANDILHIGDNEFADFKNAKEVGLEAFYLEKPMELFFKDFPKMKIFYDLQPQSLTASIIVGICLKKWLLENKELKNYWQYFGYFYGGAMCYGLSQWIYENAVKENLKEFIFVARDGYMIEKIFNLLQEHYEMKHNIRTHYIYANRSIFLSTLSTIEEINVLLPWTNKLNSYIALISTNKNFENLNLIQLSDSAKKDWIQNNLPIIKSIANSNLNIYKNYINRFRFKEQIIGLFDICSVSFSAAKLLQSTLNKTLVGYYWYAASNCNYIYHTYQSNDSKYSFINQALLEFLITSPEFPTISINHNGKPNYLYNTKEQSRIETYRIICKEELNFAKDILEVFGQYKISFECEILMNMINTFSKHVDNIDLKKFDKLYYAANDLHTEYKKILPYIQLKRNIGASQRLKNHLAYKLGFSIIQTKTFFQALKLPFLLLFIAFKHKKDMSIYKSLTKINPCLILPPLDSYDDYLESLKIKEYLSYKFGMALIENPFTFIFKMKKIYKEYKDGK